MAWFYSVPNHREACCKAMVSTRIQYIFIINFEPVNVEISQTALFHPFIRP